MTEKDKKIILPPDLSKNKKIGEIYYGGNRNLC